MKKVYANCTSVFLSFVIQWFDGICLRLERLFRILANWNEIWWNKSSSSDDRQFRQYQQNKKLPLCSNHWRQIKTTTDGDRNPGLGLGQAPKCGNDKPGNGIPNTPSWYLNHQGQYRYKQYQHRFASKNITHRNWMVYDV
jgi:hypothetical protein